MPPRGDSAGAPDWPFRLGATSYVYPGTWSYNVERLGGRVDDVELLLFEAARPPGPGELARLKRCKDELGLTYSVHTPLEVSLADENVARRRRSVRDVLGTIECVATLAPEVYIVHVYFGDREWAPRRPRDLSAWRRRTRESLAAILESGVEPGRICLETLDYDLGLLEPVIEELGLSVALDIGHCARDGRSVADMFERFLDRTRVVQWHGVAPGGRDHRSLKHLRRRDVEWVLDTLARESFRGVLTLEVFLEEDFEESLAIVLGRDPPARSPASTGPN